MLAVVAAVLFGIALLLQLAGADLGPVLETTTLNTAGFLCVALHLAGVGGNWRGLGRGRRR